MQINMSIIKIRLHDEIDGERIEYELLTRNAMSERLKTADVNYYV